jgi:hypothetical protein
MTPRGVYGFIVVYAGNDVANYEHDVDLARQDFQVVPFTVMVRVIDYC